MIKYPYGVNDPYARLELIAHTKMHSDDPGVDFEFDADQMPVLAARVSHAGSGKTGDEPEADIKLMNFLVDHKHMTPFEHQFVTFRVVAPLFVFREWHRHRTQSYNEVSMRYCSDPVGKFFTPNYWREQATRNKQSSAGNLDLNTSIQADAVLLESYETSLNAYKSLLDLGVCREQARTVIPVGNYSEMYASASLRNWYGFWLLRSDSHAQEEIRKYSDAIGEILYELYPNSWRALAEDRSNES